MFTRIRSRLTYANVASSIALFAALGTGGAYAANTVGSSDIIDNSVASVDLKDGDIKAVDIGVGQVLGSRIVDETVKTEDLADNRVATADLKDGDVQNIDLHDGAVDSAKVLDESLGATDLATSSVTSSEIATNAVNGGEIASSAIDGGEVVDFGLSNQDVGVLFAEVNADGTLASSSGFGVTATKLAGEGQYEVDFARDVAACTAVATLGSSTNTTQPGQVNVADRGGDAEAVFVDTNNTAGAALDRAFRLVVVC